MHENTPTLLLLHGPTPQFHCNQDVFVMIGGQKGYITDVITSICLKTTNEQSFYIEGYETFHSFYYSKTGFIKPQDITTDESLAQSEMKFTPVSLSDEEWQLAIGERGYDADFSKDGSKVDIEDCELGLCCKDISDIRDILIECKENGGLNHRQIKRLSELIILHEPPTKMEHLKKILDAVALRWA